YFEKTRVRGSMQNHRGRTSIRKLTLADLRSVTGLIIGLYVTMHLSNHAIGLISVHAQEAGAAVGNGALAFAARPAAVVRQSEHSRGNCAGDIISSTPLLHARVGSNPNFAWPNDSLSVACPHREHQGHPHSYRDRHRLYLRDCQSLGRSLGQVSTDRARVVGVGPFCDGIAFLVAALRLVSGGFPGFSSRVRFDSYCSLAWIRRSWDDNDSPCAKRSPMDARDQDTRRASGPASGQVAGHTEGLGRTVVDCSSRRRFL